ncbi:MAG: PTS sugar transporter subunit IIB [Longicatena sp.]
MANIKLVRIDFRLIHGQVVNKWIKITLSNKIIVIDDTLAANEFMRSVYAMAAPPGVDVLIYGEDEAVDKWKENQFGDGNVLVLFKSVKAAHKCYMNGFNFEELQIGGLGASPGRKIVFGPITLDQTDANELKEIQDKGARVYFHQVPEDGSAELNKILEKF